MYAAAGWWADNMVGCYMKVLNGGRVSQQLSGRADA